MSLVGNLQDLGLGEILQIVSLSRKSGLLSLTCCATRAQVVFKGGQVIRAHSSASPARLGEVLVQNAIADAATVKRALEIQAQEGYRQLLGPILIDRFRIDPELIEEVVRGQIEQVVYGLFEWQEGEFEFEIKEVGQVVDNARLDPVQFMLAQGLNPQYLAMEGTRILDEKRHRQEAGTEPEVDDQALEFAFNLAAEPEPAPQPEPVARPLHPESVPTAPLASPATTTTEPGLPLVLVDDDPAMLAALGRLLSDQGYRVAKVQGGEEALIMVDTLCSQGGKPAVIVDLVMPRMDGSGVYGGLELLELIRNNFPDLSLLGMSDLPDREAEAAAALLEVAVLAKPKTEGDLGSFGALLCEGLSRATGAGSRYGGPRVNIGDELRLEMGEEPALSAPQLGTATASSALRGMLDELNTSLSGGIILLVLRFAAQFMNRATVLLVKREQIQGLGQFGVDLEDAEADARVRALRIPREAPSLFRNVIESRFSVKGPLENSRWNDYFLAELGGGRPLESFTGPIVSQGKVVALLYGDNLPELKPIGDTEALEIFLSQAGIAMEKALLQRRLKEKGQEEM